MISPSMQASLTHYYKQSGQHHLHGCQRTSNREVEKILGTYNKAHSDDKIEFLRSTSTDPSTVFAKVISQTKRKPKRRKLSEMKVIPGDQILVKTLERTIE